MRKFQSQLRQFVTVAVCWVLILGTFSCGGSTNSTPPPPPPGASFSVSPTSLDFGSVAVGSSASKTVTLTNSGAAAASVSQATPTGAGFAVSGLTLPLNVAAGKNATITVTFSPTAAGAVTGTLSLVNDTANSPLTVALTGTGGSSTGAQLTAAPATVAFGTVFVGNSANVTVTLTNNGTSGISISQASVSGGAFSTSGLTLPANLSAGQSTTMKATFTPAAAGTFSGSVSIVHSGTNSPLSISLSGSGTTTTQTSRSISINTAVTHQTWRGFGMTLQAYVQFGSGCVEPSDALFAQEASDVVNTLGLTRMRFHFHYKQGIETAANDNGDPFTINQAYFNWDPVSGTGFDKPRQCTLSPAAAISKIMVPMRNQVVANGEPFEVYISAHWKGCNVGDNNFSCMPAWWQNSVDEGSEVFQASANWFYSHAGFYPQYYTWNEPSSSYFGSTSWMGGWAKSLGTRLSAAGIASAPVQSPETVNVSDAVWELNNVLSVSGAQAYIKRVSFHAYDYNGALQWPAASGITARNSIRDLAQSIGAETGMTEICCKQTIINGTAVNWGGQYEEGVDWVRDAYLNMTQADISFWEELALHGICSQAGCPVGSGEVPIGFEPDGSTYYLQPVGWVLRQFARYIRPGYVRVDANCSNCMDTGTSPGGPDVKAVAWKRPNGTVVVAFINDSGAGRDLNLAGLPNGTYNLHMLDGTMCSSAGGRNRCTPTLATISVANGTATLSAMPAGAVWTLEQQ